MLNKLLIKIKEAKHFAKLYNFNLCCITGCVGQRRLHKTKLNKSDFFWRYSRTMINQSNDGETGIG